VIKIDESSIFNVQIVNSSIFLDDSASARRFEFQLQNPKLSSNRHGSLKIGILRAHIVRERST